MKGQPPLPPPSTSAEEVIRAQSPKGGPRGSGGLPPAVVGPAPSRPPTPASPPSKFLPPVLRPPSPKAPPPLPEGGEAVYMDIGEEDEMQEEQSEWEAFAFGAEE